MKGRFKKTPTDPWAKCGWPTKWSEKNKAKKTTVKQASSGPMSPSAFQKLLQKSKEKEKKDKQVKSELLKFFYGDSDKDSPYVDSYIPNDYPDINECKCHKHIEKASKVVPEIQLQLIDLDVLDSLFTNLKTSILESLAAFTEELAVYRAMVQDAAAKKVIQDEIKMFKKQVKEEITPEFGKRYIELD